MNLTTDDKPWFEKGDGSSVFTCNKMKHLIKNFILKAIVKLNETCNPNKDTRNMNNSNHSNNSI